MASEGLNWGGKRLGRVELRNKRLGKGYIEEKSGFLKGMKKEVDLEKS